MPLRDAMSNSALVGVVQCTSSLIHNVGGLTFTWFTQSKTKKKHAEGWMLISVFCDGSKLKRKFFQNDYVTPGRLDSSGNIIVCDLGGPNWKNMNKNWGLIADPQKKIHYPYRSSPRPTTGSWSALPTMVCPKHPKRMAWSLATVGGAFLMHRFSCFKPITSLQCHA